MNWIVRNVSWLIVGLTAIAVLLVAATVYVITQEAGVEKKIGGVEVVGPCRDLGPDNPECRRQSRLIIESCLTHRDCLALVARLAQNIPDRGGDADQNPPSGGGLDGPSDEGGPGGDGEGPPGNSGSDGPQTPDPDGMVDELEDTASDAIGAACQVVACPDLPDLGLPKAFPSVNDPHRKDTYP